MFDNPRRKLDQMEEELLEIQEPEEEGEDEDYEMDDRDAVYAPAQGRPGLRTLVFLAVMLVLILAAGRWLGWL